jgi:cell division topological specificity factor
MSFLSFLLGEKKKTASVAKERLQIILAHERSSLSGEAAGVPGRPAARAGGGDLQVRVDQAPRTSRSTWKRQDDLEVLDIKIELPDPAPTPAR